MDTNLIANALSLTLFIVSFFVSIRSFYLYSQSRSRRLLVLALSMLVISLTAIAGFLGDNLTSITLNVDWFNYIGQTISFLFILLSLARNSDKYLRSLVRWHFFISALLLILLLLAPLLPPEFPNPVITKTLLSGSRGVICIIIFFFYVNAFMSKDALFSVLMAGAFLLLSVGYLVILPKYGSSNADLLDHVGDISRITGLVTLLIAVLL